MTLLLFGVMGVRHSEAQTLRNHLNKILCANGLRKLPQLQSAMTSDGWLSCDAIAAVAPAQLMGWTARVLARAFKGSILKSAVYDEERHAVWIEALQPVRVPSQNAVDARSPPPLPRFVDARSPPPLPRFLVAFVRGYLRVPCQRTGVCVCWFALVIVVVHSAYHAQSLL